MNPLVMDPVVFIGSLCFVSIIVFYGSLLVVFIALGGFVLLFSERLKKIEDRWRELDVKKKEYERK